MKFLGRKPMNHFSFLFLILIVGLFFTITTYAELPIPGKPAINVSSGQTFYTKFSLFYEKYYYRTTNYRKGLLVPANTAVKFVSANSESITVTLPDGQELQVINVERYSQAKIDEIFTQTFSSKPIDLSGFTKEERKSIMLGEVQLGMRKSAVLIALGYPPKHATPSLESNPWTYWRNRFSRFLIYFDEDKVAKIER